MGQDSTPVLNLSGRIGGPICSNLFGRLTCVSCFSSMEHLFLRDFFPCRLIFGLGLHPVLDLVC